MLDCLGRGGAGAGVVAAPEVQGLLPGRGRAQGHLVALAAGRRQHVSLVVTALAGDEEGIGAAAHQIEAILMRTLAKSAGHGLGTDVGDEGAGEGVDLRERATDPDRLGEQDRDQESGVFLVALVECLLDGVAKLAQAVAEGVAPVADEVQVHEHRLRPGLPEFRALREQHADLAEALAACVITEHHEQQPITGEYQRRGRCVAVGQSEIELLSHQQGKEVGPDEVGHVAQFGKDPLDLDDAVIVALRQLQQPLVAPAAHRQPHPDHRVAHAWLARLSRQLFAELVERLKPNLQRLLEPVLRDAPLEPQVGEARAVRGLAQVLLGLVE